jgi:hypothetical protein
MFAKAENQHEGDLMMSNLTTKIPALVALSIVWLTGSKTAAEELSGSKIKQLITGETVRLNTPFGIALPLRYLDGGVVVDDVSTISAASMFAPKEEGRWWVEEDQLCQQLPTWYNGRQFCFKITSTGEGKISWLRDDGVSGTARIGN